MIASDFPESNLRIGPPPDLEESQCHTIPAYRGQIQGGSCDGLPQIVVAWVPTAEELGAINAGKPIFLSFVCEGLPPHFPSMSFYQATHPA